MDYVVASTPDNIPDDEPEDNDVKITYGRGRFQRYQLVREHILAHYIGTFRPNRSDTWQMDMTMENPFAYEMMLTYLHYKQFIQCPPIIQQGPQITFHNLIDIWNIGLRYEIPIVQNAAVNVFVNRIKHTALLPSGNTVDYLWSQCPPGSTLRCLLVDVVREMWIPDGHKLAVWGGLVGGISETPDDLNWAIDELVRSGHTVRISHKTMVRLLACEWHIHEENDDCEGSEEYQLKPEHLLYGQMGRESE